MTDDLQEQLEEANRRATTLAAALDFACSDIATDFGKKELRDTDRMMFVIIYIEKALKAGNDTKI